MLGLPAHAGRAAWRAGARRPGAAAGALQCASRRLQLDLLQRPSRRQVSTAQAHTYNQAGTSPSWHNLAFLAGLFAVGTYVTTRKQPIVADAKSSSSSPPPKDQNAAKRKIGKKELEKHVSREDCWIAIGDLVYDVTEFLEQHPGGSELILEHAGKDVTTLFTRLHPKGTLEHTLSPFSVQGAIDPSSKPETAVQDQDEDDIEARRQALPPAASVLNLSTFEKYAQEVLGDDSRSWVYISSWADDGVSYGSTKDSFTHVRFLPRVAIPVSDCLANTVLAGCESVLPVYISATGQNRAAHPDGEINSLRCAHNNGLIQMVSNGSSVSLAELLEERQKLKEADGPNGKLAKFWFQLYLRRGDRARNDADLKTAKEGKVDAIVLTLDAVALGNHEKNRNHPERLLAAGEIKEGIKGLKPLAMGTLEPDISWKDVDYIKKHAPGIPVMVKGVLSVDDIELAYKHGATAVILSNHGGRQLDYAPPPLAVLARTHLERPDLLKKIEVYIDGGITRGTDVLKALCLGAKGVGLGRVPFYAQACYGEEGVTRAFQIMSDELTTGMRLLGCNRISDLKPELLEIMPGLLGQQPKSHKAETP